MSSSLWIVLFTTYLVFTVSVFFYTQRGLMFTLDQVRVQTEAAKTYAKELSNDRDHDIEDLRKELLEFRKSIEYLTKKQQK